MNKASEEFALKVFGAFPEALDFVTKLVDALHLWDDLIDKDQPVSDEAINRAFLHLLVDLPRNAFYTRYFAELNPLLRQAIINWFVATQAERDGSPQEQIMAFILRSSYVDVVAASVVLCHGLEKGLPLVRELRGIAHSEGIEGYFAALENERKSRDVL